MFKLTFESRRNSQYKNFGGLLDSWIPFVVLLENKNNCYYLFSFIFYKIIPIYKISFLVQTYLYANKIYWHDSISNQCTPDFNCCSKWVWGKNLLECFLELFNGKK